MTAVRCADSLLGLLLHQKVGDGGLRFCEENDDNDQVQAQGECAEGGEEWVVDRMLTVMDNGDCSLDATCRLQ